MARNMTVAELIGRLEECDPDATVRIMMQEDYPFECDVHGVATRESFTESECDCDHKITEPHAEDCSASDEYGETWSGVKLQPNDVFIVEGAQECYGSKAAWDAARW